ncbi:LppU/SCO3897 family protein [Lentzea sp. NPDC054927]
MWRQWIVPGVLTTACVAGLTVLAQELKAEHPAPTPSDCYAVIASKRSVGLEETDCAAYNATYRVSLRVDSPDWSLDPAACPDGPYRALRPRPTADTLCMTLNVREGDCLQHAKPWGKTGSRFSELARNTCGPAAEVKVTKVVTGARESCGPGEKTNHYSQSALTVCLGKP